MANLAIPSEQSGEILLNFKPMLSMINFRKFITLARGRKDIFNPSLDEKYVQRIELTPFNTRIYLFDQMDSPNQDYEIQLLRTIDDGHRWKNLKVLRGSGEPCTGNMYTTKGGGFKTTTFKSYKDENLRRMHIQTFGYNGLASYAHVVVYWHRMHPNTLPHYETHRIRSNVNDQFTMPFDTPEGAKNAELIIKHDVLPYYTFGTVRPPFMPMPGDLYAHPGRFDVRDFVANNAFYQEGKWFQWGLHPDHWAQWYYSTSQNISLIRVVATCPRCTNISDFSDSLAYAEHMFYHVPNYDEFLNLNSHFLRPPKK